MLSFKEYIMQQAQKKYLTHQEYFELEEVAENKSQYYQGEIFDMAGASINHNRIAGNIYTSLNQALNKKNCEAFINEMRIWISLKDLFTYPDVMVICGKPEFYPDRDDTIINPLIIFEVLSKSTGDYDRGEKFEFYRSIPSFQEYVLLDQYKIHVEHFFIDDNKRWTLIEHNNSNDVLELTKIDFKISIEEIYARVEF